MNKAAYIYNARGQRTRKVTPAGTTVYHYDLKGLLIGETTAAGEIIRDYLWQGMSPVAQIDHNAANDTVHYLHTDHLMTPRLATNQNKQITWRWEGEAFGETNAREDPDGDGNTTTINLRFPGQYYDSETGLHYNWNRDYNPHTGRYRQSDLIGLDGGLNTYGYAGGNPVMYTDPFGLLTINVGLNVTGVIGDTDTNPGGVKGGGSYLDIGSNGVEYGGYTVTGEAIGADSDASVTIGITFDSSDFEGGAISTGYDIGPVSLNINLNPDTFIPVGFEIGIGPGKGFSVSETDTEKVPVVGFDFNFTNGNFTNGCPD